MGKPTLTDLQAYVDGLTSSLDGRLQEVEGTLRAAMTPGPGVEPDNFEDIRYRAEAVKEATLRTKVIFDKAKIIEAGAIYEVSPAFVDEVLKIAGFLLSENSTAPVTIYNDHYHYNDTTVSTAD